MNTGDVYRMDEITYIVILARDVGTKAICAVHDNGSHTFIPELPEGAKACNLGNDNQGKTPTHVRKLIEIAVSIAASLRQK
jgi:hypothetical protein